MDYVDIYIGDILRIDDKEYLVTSVDDDMKQVECTDSQESVVTFKFADLAKKEAIIVHENNEICFTSIVNDRYSPGTYVKFQGGVEGRILYKYGGKVYLELDGQESFYSIDNFLDLEPDIVLPFIIEFPKRNLFKNPLTMPKISPVPTVNIISVKPVVSFTNEE